VEMDIQNICVFNLSDRIYLTLMADSHQGLFMNAPLNISNRQKSSLEYYMKMQTILENIYFKTIS